MTSKKIVVLALFFLLPVSGCILPGGIDPFNSNPTPGTGVIITDFAPDIQGDINSGETVTFAVKVKNTGSVKAEEAYGELIGLDYVWEPIDPKDRTKMTSLGETFPNEEKCRYVTRGMALLPEDKEAGTSGEEALCTWTYKAPPVKTGLSITSTARARFYYTYSSATIKTITLLSRDELKNVQNQGKALPMETQSSTNSPISFDVQSASPIKVYDKQAEFPIIITIKNVGGGSICRGDEASNKYSINCKKEGGLINDKDLNRFTLKITLPDGLKLDETTCKNEEEIVMVGSSQQMLSCKVMGPVDQMIGIAQRYIRVEAKYGYFIDKTFSVRVVPSNVPK